MFGLRGLSGEVFRGPLDQLLKVHRVAAPNPSRSVEGDHDQTPLPAPLVTPRDEPRYHAAVTAYAASEHAGPERGPVYHAYQVMSRNVLCLPASTGVVEAWRALAQRGVGQAPVTTDGAVVGLVARSDLLHVLNEENGQVTDARPRTVAQVMTTPVVTVSPVADVRRIARVMLEYHVPALPVVDESTGALEGIVTRGDLLRCVVTEPPLTLWA